MSSKLEDHIEGITGAIFASVTTYMIYEAVFIASVSAVAGGALGFFTKRMLHPIWEHTLKDRWDRFVKKFFKIKSK